MRPPHGYAPAKIPAKQKHTTKNNRIGRYVEKHRSLFFYCVVDSPQRWLIRFEGTERDETKKCEISDLKKDTFRQHTVSTGERTTVVSNLPRGMTMLDPHRNCIPFSVSL